MNDAPRSSVHLTQLRKLIATGVDEDGRTWRTRIETLWKAGHMMRRGLWYQLWFRQCAGPLLIGHHVTIRNAEYISAGHYLVAEDYCEIQGLSHEGVVFGDRVTIGRFAMIRPSGYYGREIGVGLKVGNNSNIGPYCYIGCSGLIQIGSNVLMGPRVSMHAENHNFSRMDVPMRSQGVTRSDIHVDNDCWLGSDCVILAGVTIGCGSIIAAGSVVTQDVAPYSIVAGAPARLIRSRRPGDAPVGDQ